MAVAAYGSLLSLTHILDNVHYRAGLSRLHVDIKLIESLQEGANCLVDYVELHSQRKGLEDLWRQLSKVAFEAEQMFDLHVVEQLQLRCQGERGDLGFLDFNEDLERVIQQVEFLKKELLVVQMVQEDVQTGKQPITVAPGPGGDSSATCSSGTSAMVGFDELMHNIMDRLTSDERALQVIPIVGMGGIGKTTLARNVFNKTLIVEHFDIRIWLTISQEYSVHEILLGLLNDGHVSNHAENFIRLGESVHKKLYGRRYLIVMDDVWDIKAWDELRVFFPNNSNRSRVMMTTRLKSLASSLGCHNPYSVTFLDEEDSWNLFCKTVFAQEGCPNPELEMVGKSIASSCRGLPLEIVVIGSHLANSNMTGEYWEFIAENMKSFGDVGDYEHCMKVLYSSYNNMPIHLKLCFLHMSVYREDANIQARSLIDRWICEGLIKPDNGNDLMEIGMKYLKDLIARNLITGSSSICFQEEIEDACQIHDLFRDLCLIEWEKEQFKYSPKTQVFSWSSSGDTCFHCGTLLRDADAINLLDSIVICPTTSNVNLIICKDCKMVYSNLTRPTLVKVANLGDREELVHPMQLRYASVNLWGRSFLEFVYPTLNLLWNLQTLEFYGITRSTIVLPSEIWEMPQLRWIQSNQSHVLLPYPTITHDMGEDFVVLKNLWCLYIVLNFKCSKEVLDRIPNVKELNIAYKDELDTDMEGLHKSLCNLAHLQTLHCLSIEYADLEHAIFPGSVKELYLEGCKIHWDDMTIIGSLPNLELLYLDRSGEGPEWTPVEGEFLELKALVIESCYLITWNTDQVHFPKLESLVLAELTELEVIPSSIGDITTLQQISVIGCNKLVIEWAKNIWEEQQSMENDSLAIVIDKCVYVGEDKL